MTTHQDDYDHGQEIIDEASEALDRAARAMRVRLWGHDREDVLQEAILHALQAVDRLTDPALVPIAVYRACQNAIKQWITGRSRRVQCDPSYWQRVPDWTEESYAFLERLPREYRDVAEALALGLPYRDVMERCGISARQVTAQKRAIALALVDRWVADEIAAVR